MLVIDVGDHHLSTESLLTPRTAGVDYKNTCNGYDMRPEEYLLEYLLYLSL